MVCRECESKLSKVIVPDKWKTGAQNVERTGGYKNSLLQVRGTSQRFLAGARACRICRQKVAQDAHYCQDCAHRNGICAMCGKRVDDLRFDRRGLAPPTKRKLSEIDEDASGRGGEDYGTSQRFSKKVHDAPLEKEDEARGEALEIAQNGLARASGKILGGDEKKAKTRDEASGDEDPYSGWASTRDVASGRTYYFNAKTKETSWVWPPANFLSRRRSAANNAGSEAAAAALVPFLEAAAFQGRREGYIFTTRQTHGTGYYLDDHSPRKSNDAANSGVLA